MITRHCVFCIHSGTILLPIRIIDVCKKKKNNFNAETLKIIEWSLTAFQMFILNVFLMVYPSATIKLMHMFGSKEKNIIIKNL